MHAPVAMTRGALRLQWKMRDGIRTRAREFLRASRGSGWFLAALESMKARLVPTVGIGSAIALASLLLLWVSYLSGSLVGWLSALSPLGVVWFKTGCLLFTGVCLATVAMRWNKRNRDVPCRRHLPRGVRRRRPTTCRCYLKVACCAPGGGRQQSAPCRQSDRITNPSPSALLGARARSKTLPRCSRPGGWREVVGQSERLPARTLLRGEMKRRGSRRFVVCCDAQDREVRVFATRPPLGRAAGETCWQGVGMDHCAHLPSCIKSLFMLVGVRGFEPPASTSRT